MSAARTVDPSSMPTPFWSGRAAARRRHVYGGLMPHNPHSPGTISHTYWAQGFASYDPESPRERAKLYKMEKHRVDADKLEQVLEDLLQKSNPTVLFDALGRVLNARAEACMLERSTTQSAVDYRWLAAQVWGLKGGPQATRLTARGAG
jgi:hypothetical protein